MPHHVIDCVAIEGAARISDLALPFVDGLNCIFGGPGTCKTTVLEHTRFGLGADEPRTKKSEDQLTGTMGRGQVKVSLRTRHGAPYTTSRSLGQDTCVRDAQGAVVAAKLEGELFQLEAYRQGEIADIGSTPAAQRRVIERFAEAELRQMDDAIAAVLRQLTLNHAEEVRIREDLDELRAQSEELPAVEAALAAVVASDGPDAEAVARAHEANLGRARGRAMVAAIPGELGAVKRALDAFASEAQRRLGGACDDAVARGNDAPILQPLSDQLRALAESVASSTREMQAAIAQVDAAVTKGAAALAVRHAEANDAYKTMTLRIQEDRTRAAERERLQARVVALGAIRKRAHERAAEQETKGEERRALLAELGRLRDERYAIGAGIAA